MKRVVIDTNVVISFLTDRDPRQQEIAAKLFGDTAAAQLRIILHQTVITEVVYVLQNLYSQTQADVAAIVRELIDMPGIVVVDEMPWARLFEIWPSRIGTYADASLAAVAIAGGYEFVATFDRGFFGRLKQLGIQSYPDFQ